MIFIHMIKVQIPGPLLQVFQVPLADAVGFAMGGQGYVGTGADASTYTNDFWCYFPLTHSWVQN